MISEEMREKLNRYGQAHLIRFYGELSAAEKGLLESQLETIDFALMERLFRQIQEQKAEPPAGIEPIPWRCGSGVDDAGKAKILFSRHGHLKGRQICGGHEGGGQGTRLGHPGPRERFEFTCRRKFRCLANSCRRLKVRSEECGKTIPWYIMTSEENDAETKRFFRENGFFGYPEEDIVFFRQFMLPMLDQNGKLLLEEKYKIREGADGHGGIFRAMRKRGITGGSETARNRMGLYRRN